MFVSLWSGGTYSVEYPEKMERQFARFDLDIHIHGYHSQLQTDWTGWCAKIELFSPWFDCRPCLYVDLDTYILRDPSHLFKDFKKLMLIRDFYNPIRGNSGVMYIPENVEGIFKKYNGKEPDGNYLNKFPHGYLQDEFPNEIVSYKVSSEEQKANSTICCFHGKPKPHQTEGWAREFWDNL